MKTKVEEEGTSSVGVGWQVGFQWNMRDELCYEELCIMYHDHVLRTAEGKSVCVSTTFSVRQTL